MNQDQLTNLIQKLIVLVGGAAIAKGWGDSSVWEAVGGAVAAVVTWYWSHRGNATAGTPPTVPPAIKLMLLAGCLMLAGTGCAHLRSVTSTPVFISGSTNVAMARTELSIWTFFDATNNLTKARTSNGGPTNGYTAGTSLSGLNESASSQGVVAIIQAAAQAAGAAAK